MKMGDIPNTLEVALKAIGVIPLQPKEPEPKVERDFTFKTPTFDENGEPDF
tara:strand:+ start:5232 stop:5384 length:153 start_codon:yes stop_codon:yes gene_type:complete